MGCHRAGARPLPDSVPGVENCHRIVWLSTGPKGSCSLVRGHAGGTPSSLWSAVTAVCDEAEAHPLSVHVKGMRRTRPCRYRPRGAVGSVASSVTRRSPASLGRRFVPRRGVTKTRPVHGQSSWGVRTRACETRSVADAEGGLRALLPFAVRRRRVFPLHSLSLISSAKRRGPRGPLYHGTAKALRTQARASWAVSDPKCAWQLWVLAL